jgi:hypothetical protein
MAEPRSPRIDVGTIAIIAKEQTTQRLNDKGALQDLRLDQRPLVMETGTNRCCTEETIVHHTWRSIKY